MIMWATLETEKKKKKVGKLKSKQGGNMSGAGKVLSFKLVLLGESSVGKSSLVLVSRAESPVVREGLVQTQDEMKAGSLLHEALPTFPSLFLSFFLCFLFFLRIPRRSPLALPAFCQGHFSRLSRSVCQWRLFASDAFARTRGVDDSPAHAESTIGAAFLTQTVVMDDTVRSD